jgi:hypothetical protein
VFTARYALSPYIKQTCFVFKGLKADTLFNVTFVLLRLHFGFVIIFQCCNVSFEAFIADIVLRIVFAYSA